MRISTPMFSLAATLMVAFSCFAAIALVPGFAFADPQEGEKETGRATCTCPEGKEKLWHRPKFAGLRAPLDVSDEIATLETVQLALSEVGDGSSYVWHRYHGRLSGVVTPTASFKDANGSVCRHLVIVLSSGDQSRRSEGVACRLPTGIWQLQG